MSPNYRPPVLGAKESLAKSKGPSATPHPFAAPNASGKPESAFIKSTTTGKKQSLVKDGPLNSPQSSFQKPATAPKVPATPKDSTTPAKELPRAKQRALEEKERKEKFRLQHNYPFKRDGKAMLKDGMASLAERNCIFICIDLEMFEFQTNWITEIGIAVFELGPDTAMLPNIQAYHIQPKEWLTKINRKVMANKRSLFAHGESYIMPLDQCRLFWAVLLERYAAKAKAENKPLYLVGHDVQGDLTCLSTNKFDFDRTLPVLDTAVMWEATSAASPGLGSIVERLQIPAKFLHNAGNDAVATLRVLLALLDPVVRNKYELDVGPSAAEAAAAAKAARKEKEKEEKKKEKKDKEEKVEEEAEQPKEPNDKDSKDKDLPSLGNGLSPAEIKARKADKIKRDKERTKARLSEQQKDMPGSATFVTWRQLIDQIFV